MARNTDSDDQEREDWNEIAPGWKKWDAFLMERLRPVGEKVLDMANLKNGDVVLDVATGSGEPGLSAARRVGSGKVVGLDISEEMIKTAKMKAEALGVKNYEPRLYSGVRFPFENDQFDGVVSRFGVMFFPDLLGGLKEMARVLRPGRNLSVAVWGPQNETAKSVMMKMNSVLGLPPPEPDGPGPYRCSKAGSVGSLMTQAGLRNTSEVDVWTRRSFVSAGQYLEYVLDINPTLAKAVAQAGEKEKRESQRIMEEGLGSIKAEDGQIHMSAVARVTSGTK